MSSSLKCLSVPIKIRFSIKFVNHMDTFVVHTIGYGLIDKRHSQERIILNVIVQSRKTNRSVTLKRVECIAKVDSITEGKEF